MGDGWPVRDCLWTTVESRYAVRNVFKIASIWYVLLVTGFEVTRCLHFQGTVLGKGGNDINHHHEYLERSFVHPVLLSGLSFFLNMKATCCSETWIIIRLHGVTSQ